MSTLSIRELPHSAELDRTAMSAIRGGAFYLPGYNTSLSSFTFDTQQLIGQNQNVFNQNGGNVALLQRRRVERQAGPEGRQREHGQRVQRRHAVKHAISNSGTRVKLMKLKYAHLVTNLYGVATRRVLYLSFIVQPRPVRSAFTGSEIVQALLQSWRSGFGRGIRLAFYGTLCATLLSACFDIKVPTYKRPDTPEKTAYSKPVVDGERNDPARLVEAVPRSVPRFAGDEGDQQQFRIQGARRADSSGGCADRRGARGRVADDGPRRRRELREDDRPALLEAIQPRDAGELGHRHLGRGREGRAGAEGRIPRNRVGLARGLSEARLGRIDDLFPDPPVRRSDRAAEADHRDQPEDPDDLRRHAE